MVLRNPASAPEIIISMSVVHEDEIRSYVTGERIWAQMYSKNNHDSFGIDRTNNSLRTGSHHDVVNRILTSIDFNAALVLETNSHERGYDAKAIIAQRNAMILDMYNEFDRTHTQANSPKTRSSDVRNAKNGKLLEEEFSRKQKVPSIVRDNSGSGSSCAISSGVMGRNSSAGSSYDISLDVTPTGNSRETSSDIALDVTLRGNSRGSSFAV